MIVSEIMVKMIDYSKGNLHDINHFMKVYAYAKTIGECENLAPSEQNILEIASIVHDIACPLCREKHGNTNGRNQETEGMALTREFLRGTNLLEEDVDRIVFLVGHHHTLKSISDKDYQILIEADYLVNADESNYPESNIRNAKERIFKTTTGTALLKSVFGI